MRASGKTFPTTPAIEDRCRASELPDSALPEHHSAELTRPLRLSRAVIVAAGLLTAGMFAMLGLGIGRERLGMTKPMPPGQLEVRSANIGRSGMAARGRQVMLTPDGTTMVYVMETESGDNVLAYQLIGSDMPVLIQGSQSIVSPEISRNGRYITGTTEDARGSNRRVRIPVKGGTPSPITSEPDERLAKLEADGLRGPQLIDRDRSALGVRVAPGREAGRVFVRNLKTGKEVEAVDGDVIEARSAAGYVFFVRPDGSLWAAPFDVRSGRTTAPPVQIGSGVTLSGSGVAQFSVSKNGSVAYLPDSPSSLVIVSRDGKLKNATSSRRAYSSPRFSPDGRRISTDFADEEGRDVWTVSVDSGRLKRATYQRDAHDATWTPDGRFISFTSYKLGALGIYRSQPGDRTRRPDSVFTAQPLVYSGDWLKDGSGIVTIAADFEPGSKLDIALIGNRGRGPLQPLLVDRFDTRFPAVSPDGKWLAYVSNSSGRDEVYVRSWDGRGRTIPISRRGGTEPVWSPDGKELYYREAARQFLVAAGIRFDSTATLIAKRGLFPIGDMIQGFTHANYDVSPDGRTFVMVRRSSPGGITVLQNVPEMLKPGK